MPRHTEGFEQARLRLGARPLRKILVPTDLSERSWKALGVAVEFAASAGAELHLLHVVQPGLDRSAPERFPTDADIRQRTWASSPDSLRARTREGIETLHVVRQEVESHDISKAIDSYATDQDIGLIVLATAARRGAARWFMGSIAEQLVVGAPCPVLAIAEDAPEHFAPPRPTILAPIDFSETSLESLALASNLASQLDGRLLLLHVINERPLPAAYGDFAMAGWSSSEVTPQVTSALEEMAEMVEPEVETQCLVRSGLAATEIVETARSRDVDLIVVGSHGLTGFARHVLGSVAQRVLRMAPVPVLICKSGDTTD